MKCWINSFYDKLKNNFSIYNKIEENLFFERVVNGLDIKIKVMIVEKILILSVRLIVLIMLAGILYVLWKAIPNVLVGSLAIGAVLAILTQDKTKI